MRSVEYVELQNRNQIEIEFRFRKRTYFKSKYYKEIGMSNDNLLNISSNYMAHCGIYWWERKDLIDYRFLANLAGSIPVNRFCDSK
jgi:hypothetical protein